MALQGWKKEKLHNLGFLGRGKSKHRPRNDDSLYGGDYPFIQTGDVRAANLYVSKYNQTYNDKGLAQSKLWEKGTLCLTIAANIAETAILSMDACFPDSIVGFRADPSKADTKFIKYYIDTIKKQMSNVSQGATQENLSLDKIKLFDLYIPPPTTQQKIAAILSAYDDLIENNNKRIHILEEMAQRLYKHWFIDFKSPNHENIKLIQSELGLIPEGWKIKSVSDAVRVNPTTKPKLNVFAPFIPMQSLSETSMIVAPIESRVPAGGAKFINGDTLLARITPCLQNGKTGFVQFMDSDETVATGSTEFIVLRETEIVNRYFIYLLARSASFRERSINSMGGADGRQRVNVKLYDQLKICVPSKDIMGLFGDSVAPMFRSAHALAKKNQNLVKTRDLLLPRLISGELSVDDMEIAA